MCTVLTRASLAKNPIRGPSSDSNPDEMRTISVILPSIDDGVLSSYFV
jgi:hypothetical protein